MNMKHNKDIKKWYLSIEQELSTDIFTEPERQAFVSYYSEAGLFRWWRREFFLNHFYPSFSSIFEALSPLNSRVPVILDLGCGMGTQTLFFALHGAKVFSVDMDPLSLSVLMKRKEYYEKTYSVKLDITVICKNSFDLTSEDIPSGRVDGVFSIFAFNMMQPSVILLKRICSFIKPSGRIAILDGNNMVLLSRILRSWRRDTLSPKEFVAELNGSGLIVASHKGVICLPPILWNFNLFGVVAALDSFLSNANWLFPISHLIVAEKQ